MIKIAETCHLFGYHSRIVLPEMVLMSFQTCMSSVEHEKLFSKMPFFIIFIFFAYSESKPGPVLFWTTLTITEWTKTSETENLEINKVIQVWNESE